MQDVENDVRIRVDPSFSGDASSSHCFFVVRHLLVLQIHHRRCIVHPSVRISCITVLMMVVYVVVVRYSEALTLLLIGH